MTNLFNCDCLNFLKSKDCEQLFSNRKVVLITDPPFNIGYHYNSYKDKLKENEYMDFLKDVFNSRNYEGLVIIHYPEPLYKISFNIGKLPQKVVSWVYNSNTGKQHRDIAFFGIKPDFRKVIQPYKNLNDKRIQERIARGIRGGRLYDWWNINQVKNVSKEKTSHPCQMPLEVMKNIIGILPNDILVFDPFMGSGTTGLACKQLGIDFVGCEIDEEYFKICRERLK